MKTVKAFMVFLLLLIVSCGGPLVEVSDSGNPPTPTPTTPTNPEPTPGKERINFEEAVEIMDTYCAQCHANSSWMDSERELRNSSVEAQTKNKNMPPSYSNTEMPDDVRKLFLTYPF